jgi:hypothetical protein
MANLSQFPQPSQPLLRIVHFREAGIETPSLSPDEKLHRSVYVLKITGLE